MATFQMGPGTLQIPMTLFRDNRKRLIQELRKVECVGDRAYVLLQGGSEISFNDTDVNVANFRQESFFQWAFGVKEPDCYGAINVRTGRATLFVPNLPDDYRIWCGDIKSKEQFKQIYEVDDVKFTDELDVFFCEAAVSILLLLNGKNSDSDLWSQPASFVGIDKYNVNKDILHPIISECRVIKSPEEIEILRYVAQVSSEAHKKVMLVMKPGMSEYQGESEFLHHSYAVGGCRHASYTCICGTGINSAILHYGHAGAPNDRVVEDGDMCLFDMGANYCGYAADITCSFPVNGKFTDDQKLIYNAVLNATNAVLAEAKEGVSWVDMHRLSYEVLLTSLKDGGILTGSVEEMMEANLGAIFQPHGLGHLLGLDVHDVGGYLPGQPCRPTEPGFNKLRFARILKAGMYLTVEPGCYFIDCLLNKALADPKTCKFFNVDVLDRFRNFGGVRIEEDVLITRKGNKVFSIVPRTVEEIEKWMAGKK